MKSSSTATGRRSGVDAARKAFSDLTGRRWESGSGDVAAALRQRLADIEVILLEETPRERRLKATAKLEGSKAAAWPPEFETP